jgi:hypothetical protein
MSSVTPSGQAANGACWPMTASSLRTWLSSESGVGSLLMPSRRSVSALSAGPIWFRHLPFERCARSKASSTASVAALSGRLQGWAAASAEVRITVAQQA